MRTISRNYPSDVHNATLSGGEKFSSWIVKPFSSSSSCSPIRARLQLSSLGIVFQLNFLIKISLLLKHLADGDEEKTMGKFSLCFKFE